MEHTSRQHLGGSQDIYKFPNGFGASVVRHEFSYGSDQGLWELAVLDAEGQLTYATEITSDVLGYLEAQEVVETLREVMHLSSSGRRQWHKYKMVSA
jgi:hypothetical protein